MKNTTRWITATVVLSALLASACGLQLPPITIVIPDPPTNTTPADPPVVDPDPPVVEPTPEPEPPPLQDLTINVLDAASVPAPGAYCVVNGDRRFADAGIVRFSVPGSVFADCAAPGYLLRHVDLPPGTHNVHLEPIEIPKPKPVDPCAPAVDPLSCVRALAVTHAALLATNTRESCTRFLGHVLAALGTDYGYVGKIRGETQFVPKGFLAGERVGDDGKRYVVTGVSHDAIKRRDGQVIDVIGNAAANEPCHIEKCWTPGPASVEWHLVPPKDWRAENPFVPATAVP